MDPLPPATLSPDTKDADPPVNSCMPAMIEASPPVIRLADAATLTSPPLTLPSPTDTEIDPVADEELVLPVDIEAAPLRPFNNMSALVNITAPLPPAADDPVDISTEPPF